MIVFLFLEYYYYVLEHNQPASQTIPKNHLLTYHPNHNTLYPHPNLK